MRYVVNVLVLPVNNYAICEYRIECIEVDVDKGVLGLKLTEAKGRYFPLAQVREFTVEEVDE